jgi:hypothetical protein
MDLEAAEPRTPAVEKLLKGARELQTYVDNNRDFIPNHGERYRQTPSDLIGGAGVSIIAEAAKESAQLPFGAERTRAQDMVSKPICIKVDR